MSAPLHRIATIPPWQKGFSPARYLELVLSVGTVLTCLNVLHVFGGVVHRSWFSLFTLLLHVQFGLYGAAVLATLLFVLPRSRLPMALRLPLFAGFFIWLVWILVWVLIRRAFGIELSSDIIWELFTNRTAIAAVGLGEMEFALAMGLVFAVGGVLGAVSDRISQRTNPALLRRGCLVLVVLFTVVHLSLRAPAFARAKSNDQPIVAYHDYVPALLRFEQSGSETNGERPALSSLEDRARTAAWFNPRRMEQLPAIPRPRNVVWINLESFRADAITPEAMPRLTAYREQFQIKLDRQHWSGGNATQFGIFSQLTGLSGFHLHNLSRAQMADPFLTLLAKNGYRLRVAKKNQLSYIGLSVLLPEGTVQQEVRASTKEKEDRAMVDAWLQDRAGRTSRAPSFDFIAFDAMHWPYLFPPEHSLFQPAPVINGSQMILGFPEELPLVRNRYANACHFADEQIGRILDDLVARGEFDSTIVVILGDHGEEFQERGQMTHASVLNDFQARTPLWLHLPEIGPEALEIDIPTTHLDVVPTLLQTFGYDEDILYTQGRSLLEKLEPRPLLALSDTGFRVPLYRTLVTETYISRWAQRPLQYLFAGVQRRDGKKVEGDAWHREVLRWNAKAGEMYELLPDVSAPPRKFTLRAGR